jgi:carbonyl reductase 1|eukprot:TRINITY_DN56956_c0_g1_i1.p1 TRINITY_DN56956_c0_g1~~TRINITY_DN56956_c0_g1_i1.p1  ORF type:complete len:275 (-),score=41.25 TRINITY_DN56956_c0_g1_i1:58-882(-)
MESQAESVPGQRLAVVTGGNKGIGYFIAQQLQVEGFSVIIACRNAALASPAAAELGVNFELLDITSQESIAAFVQTLHEKYGRLDVLVNNAAIAFKGSDPTSFEQQTEPTLKTNFYGTVALTDQLLPLLRASASSGRSPRIVNVASMAGRLGQLQPRLQHVFASPQLTRQELVQLVEAFAADVQAGRHRENGWGNSNYGFSKLALIAYTRIIAREEGDAMRINACCPGYCRTDMSSNSGPRPPEVGARNASMLVLLPDGGPTGRFFQDERESSW